MTDATADLIVAHLRMCLADMLAEASTDERIFGLLPEEWFQYQVHSWSPRYKVESPLTPVSPEAASKQLEMAVTEFKRRFGVRYVLVLCDEAATLLRQSNVVDMQNFRLFRRVFTVQGITACFARTQSKVQNFAPALHRDDSWRFYRMNDMDSPYMPAPFISVSPPDIGMKLTLEAKELPPYPLALSDLHSPAWLSRFGRPLCFAFARHSLVREHLSQVLVAVAKSKMNFDTTGNSVGSLAAVMCVAALKPTPSVELAEQLVHSHMAPSQ